MSSRKFFKTVITVTVLSEDGPPEWNNLRDLHYLIEQGPCVGKFGLGNTTKITAKRMVGELLDAGSGPDFFQLDEDENDIDHGSDSHADG
jgi:ABC-type Na+ transport system ATPase subunit NatA